MTICLWHFCRSETRMGLVSREAVLGMVEVLMLRLGLADKRAASQVSCPQGFSPPLRSPHPGRRPKRREGTAWPRAVMAFDFSNY